MSMYSDGAAPSQAANSPNEGRGDPNGTSEQKSMPVAPARQKPGRGRPTKYRRDMCDQVIACGRQGMGRAEIAAELDVSRDTLRNWERQHPEFFAAMRRAHDLELAWWEGQGRRGIWAGKEFNANAYGLQMRNRFAAEYSRPDVAIDLHQDIRLSADAFTSAIARLAATSGEGGEAGGDPA
jgi:hypothetical protein